MLKDKHILITGGGGFIGSWLIERFYKSNTITILDNGRRNAFQFLDNSIKSEVELLTGDVLDQKKIAKIIKGKDIVLHLAAIAGASSYEKDPLQTLQVNFLGTENILKSALVANVEKIILFSTSETYGPNAKNVSEITPTTIGPATESRWSYAVSKLASDHFAMAYYKKHQLPVTIVRPFNVYGPRQVGEGAIVNMLKTATQLKKICVTGDGKQKRAWCYVTDLVDAIELMLEKTSSGEIYNIGNPDEYCSVLTLAKKISKITNSEIEFIEAKNTEIFDRLPNISKAQRKLGFTVKIDLDTGLKLTKEWIEQVT